MIGENIEILHWAVFPQLNLIFGTKYSKFYALNYQSFKNHQTFSAQKIFVKNFLRHGYYAKMSVLFSPLFWYMDIKNPLEIKVSTASKVGTEKLEQCRMKAQSLENRQISVQKKFC